MGGGYEPEPEVPAEPEPIPEEYDMADQSQTWDQVYTQANSQNIKRFVEEWAELSPQQGEPAGQLAGSDQSACS